MGVTIFRNKILANLSKLYSPEHFNEILEAAEISQEIMRLTSPSSSAWRESNGKTEQVAGNIVSSGLFSFLRGGLPSFNQIWVFCVCCYVTATIAVQLLLPPAILQYINILLNISTSYVRASKEITKLSK